MTEISVIGLGNVLMSDDGFGPYAALMLDARFTFPKNVVVEDLGTPGLDLHPFVAEREALIIVDTVRADAPGGEVRLYRRADLLKHMPQQRLTPHDPGVKETLLSLEFSGGGPEEVLLVGVVPVEVRRGMKLSPEVEASYPRVEEEVLRELERFGVQAELRIPPHEPDLWWMKDPDGTGRTE